MSAKELLPGPAAAPGWRARLKALAGPRWTTRLRRWTRGLPAPRWGNLRRVQPFSPNFGFERGQPIDRFYIERFFAAHRAAMVGDGLEIQSVGYLRRFGATNGQ